MRDLTSHKVPQWQLTAVKTTLCSATQQIEWQLGGLKGLLERLFLEGNLQIDQVNKLSHTMNSLKRKHCNTTLRRSPPKTTTTSPVTQRTLSRWEKWAEMLQKINLVLCRVLKFQSSHEWILKG